MQKLCGAAWIAKGRGMVWCNRPRGHRGTHDTLGRSSFLGQPATKRMKRKNTSAIELARAKVQNLEAELGEWCGSQTVPAPASAHLAYLVRVGEIEKARAALRRLELKSKRINRQLAQPELFDSTTPAAARDGAG